MIKKIFEKNYLTVLILICFSIVFNTFYASKGVFPIDTFYHYDTGFRVLNNELPVRDYWVTSGILVDLIEAFFFKIFGVSWLSHVLHASIINALIVVFTFFVLKKFNLNSFYSFCYSLLFGMLAYPPSGTPFVDHHAIFLLLGGTYIFLLGIKTEKTVYSRFPIGIDNNSEKVYKGTCVSGMSLSNCDNINVNKLNICKCNSSNGYVIGIGLLNNTYNCVIKDVSLNKLTAGLDNITYKNEYPNLKPVVYNGYIDPTSYYNKIHLSDKCEIKDADKDNKLTYNCGKCDKVHKVC